MQLFEGKRVFLRSRAIQILFMVLFVSIIHSHPARASGSLLLAAGDFPPYCYEKAGQLTGIAVEIVNALMKQTGHSAEIKILPWKRAHKYAESQPVMMLPLTRLPYRENRYKWIGPIMSDNFVFVVRREEKAIFDGIDAFFNFQVGVSESTPTMNRLLELGFKNLQVVASERMNAKKLLIGYRIDAWYGPYLIIMHTIINAGLDVNSIRVAHKDMDVEMYIGASLAVPDATVASWQKNLDEMKENGQYQNILYQTLLQ